MRKYTEFVTESKNEKLLLESLGSAKELLMEFLSSGEESLGFFIESKMIRYKQNFKDMMLLDMRSYLDKLTKSLPMVDGALEPTIQKESYQIQEDNDDFAEEHAKVVISDYLDNLNNRLENGSLQESFETMIEDNSLEEDADGAQMQIKNSLIELSESILNQSKNIKLINVNDSDTLTKEQKEDYLLKVVPKMRASEAGELANLVDEFLGGAGAQGEHESDKDYVLYYLASLDEDTLNKMYNRAWGMGH